MLRQHKLGEADRIVTLLTRDHGLVRAVAKGVRRTRSKFGARLEPFAHIDVRGTRARWGTADRHSYASGASSHADSYGEREASASNSHCQAEGASAVLCQGFRHTH